MKVLRRTLLILFLLITLAYVANITGIPDYVLLFKGEELNLGELFGLYIKEENKYSETIETSARLEDVETIERSTIRLRLFNIIDVKEIEVNTIPTTSVIPLGNTVRS